MFSSKPSGIHSYTFMWTITILQEQDNWSNEAYNADHVNYICWEVFIDTYHFRERLLFYKNRIRCESALNHNRGAELFLSDGSTPLSDEFALIQTGFFFSVKFCAIHALLRDATMILSLQINVYSALFQDVRCLAGKGMVFSFTLGFLDETSV